MIGPTRAYRYGDHPAQVADLHLPGPVPSPLGVAVLVHGGFWRARYDRSLEHRVAADLVGSGWAVWNLDYRGVDRTVAGPDGGGWPTTYQDVADAADLLVDAAPEHALELNRVVAIGHSAGGALALWLAGRNPADGGPGVPPRLRVHAVVAQAGVCDLGAAHRAGLGDGAVRDLFGGAPVDARLLADPITRVPLGVPTLLVTGGGDDVVPGSLSLGYSQAARAAGDTVDVWRDPDAGHLDHLDPGSAAWTAVRAWLSSLG